MSGDAEKRGAEGVGQAQAAPAHAGVQGDELQTVGLRIEQLAHVGADALQFGRRDPDFGHRLLPCHAVAMEVGKEILTNALNNDDTYCDGVSIFSGISIDPFDRDIFTLDKVKEDLYRPTYYCTYNKPICPDGYNMTTVSTSVLNPDGSIQTSDFPILCTKAAILEP